MHVITLDTQMNKTSVGHLIIRLLVLITVLNICFPDKMRAKDQQPPV